MANQPVQYLSAEVGPGYAIYGLKETWAMLDNFPKVIFVSGVVQALDAAAKVIEAELEPRIPIRISESYSGDLIVEGGNLQAAMMHTITLDDAYRGGWLQVGFGKLGYIANFVEYGHRMVGHKPGLKELSGPKTPGGVVQPYPFMRPAFFASQEAVSDAIAISLAKTVVDFSAKQNIA